MEERIHKAVTKALFELGAENMVFSVERPGGMSHGDYATNAALVAAKTLKKNPHSLAKELVESLTKTLNKSLSKVEIAGPGFINFTLANPQVRFVLTEADAQGEKWGRGKFETNRRIMVEYAQPNPFKEMHIGHLMSITIGESIARLIQNAGAELAHANYQGDVGPHVAKAIWGLRKAGITEPTTAKELSEAYVVGNHAYEENSEAKVEIDLLNKAIYEAKDHELMELWRKDRDVSLEAFEVMYRVLGTKFDFYFFESETAGPGTTLVRDGLAKGVFEMSDGAVIYKGEKKGLHTLVFITSRETPTYEAKEIGLAFLKEERWPSDRSIVTTSTEQIGHFKVVKAALEDLAPLLGKKTEHVAHGFLRLTSGKMSSREGNVIAAAQFIKDVTLKAAERSPDPLIAEQIAVGAIKYMILRQSPGQDIVFDPEKSLSLEGDSGPYLQYALVRANSVLEQAKEKGNVPSKGVPDSPYHLERLIPHFPEVAARAAQELAPNLLVTYLTELAGEWNSFYAKERIIGDEHEAHKLILARAFVNTMSNGLKLLGIPTPAKM